MKPPRLVLLVAFLLSTAATAGERPDYARFGALAAEAKYCGRQDMAEELIFAFFGFSGFQESFAAREAEFVASGRRDWHVLCPRVESETPHILARYFVHREIPFRELPDNLLPYHGLGDVAWRGMAQWEGGPAPILAEAELLEGAHLALTLGRARCAGLVREIPRSDPYTWAFDGDCGAEGQLTGELALDRSALRGRLARESGEILHLSLIPAD